MEKALEILNQQLRDETLWLDSHEEAIAELEAINLTRREWYQKGFNEAMKPKTCDGCKFRNTVKFVQVESETLECCSVCVRNCYDYYEPKDNS